MISAPVNIFVIEVRDPVGKGHPVTVRQDTDDRPRNVMRRQEE
jgi:hypothetical protein